MATFPIYENPGALSPAEAAAILAANPPSQLPTSTVRTPRGPAPRPHYRRSRSGDITQPPAVVTALRQRFADLCGLPLAHIEPAQMVNYGRGEYYGLHNDNPQDPASAEQMQAHGGPRKFTAVVAISDSHDGGGLYFPENGWPAVHPKLGWFTWWRNTGRAARHEALPVEKGHRTVVVLFARKGPYVE